MTRFYDPEMVDAVVRQMSFSERTTVQFFEFLEELGWRPPVKPYDKKYTEADVAAVARRLPLAEKRQDHWARIVLDEMCERGWRPPSSPAGKVRQGEWTTDELCPTCGGNLWEHVLVAPPTGSDEADYYECIENLLIRHAEDGDEISTAAMAYIERIKDERGLRGSMGSDNSPSFMEDPGNERWRETVGVDPDTHPRAVCPYPNGCTGCYEGDAIEA